MFYFFVVNVCYFIDLKFWKDNLQAIILLIITSP
jgi:hypothetical protein